MKAISLRLLCLLSPCLLFCAAGCNPDPYPGEEGSILHVSLRLLPKSFDPPLIEEEGSGKVSAHVYDGFLMYHPFARPYKLIPALADGMPRVSEDKKTYTFKIKRGILFQGDPCFAVGDGNSGRRTREVSAADFLFCFKRFAHPSTQAKGWWLFSGWILGLDAWREQLEHDLERERKEGREPGKLWGLERPVEGFEVVDRYTFRLRLTKPYPQLLWVLAMPYTSVYPREAVEYYGGEFGNHPVGTGPFKVVEYNPVYRVLYERNENFREAYVPNPREKPDERWSGWEEDEKQGFLINAGKQIPLIDGMEIRFILEDQPRWLYFKSGYTDFLNPPKDNTDEAVPGGELSPRMKERGVRLYKWPELGTVYTCLNTEDPVLSNVDLRRAMALAFDHKWTCEHLYAGQAIVAKSLIPPGVAGFDPDYHPYHSDDGTAQIDKARAMLAKAGYPGGIDPRTGRKLRLVFENSGTSLSSRHFANRFVDEMSKIGINIDKIVNTFPQMIAKMRKKAFQVAGLAWGFDYPDAQNILQLLYGPNESPGINAANFKNAEFDRLYDQAKLMEDSPERTRLYEAMAHIASDQVPWITRAHRIRPNLRQPWLQGFKYTETSYQYWRYAGVDAELRRKKLAEWNEPTRWPVTVLGLLFSTLVGGTILRGRSVASVMPGGSPG
ncbi:MAG: ABC transporter substrate-binding protein [Planctomycetota bacterium]